MMRAGPGKGAAADGVRRLASWAASEVKGVNGGADLAEGLGPLLWIDVQQVITECRFAAVFAPLFGLRIVECGVLAGRGLTVLITIANDGRTDKQHQVAFRHFLLLSERNRAPITGMSPSSGTLSAVSVTLLSSSPPTTTVSPLPTSTALFTVRVLKGRAEIATGAGGRVGDARYLLLNLQQHGIAFVNLRFHLQLNADGFALDGTKDVVAGGGLRAG